MRVPPLDRRTASTSRNVAVAVCGSLALLALAVGSPDRGVPDGGAATSSTDVTAATGQVRVVGPDVPVASAAAVGTATAPPSAQSPASSGSPSAAPTRTSGSSSDLVVAPSTSPTDLTTNPTSASATTSVPVSYDRTEAAEPAPELVPDVAVGTVERAYAEIGELHEGEEHPGVAAAEAGDNPGLITWVRTDAGLSVRVPTDDLRDVPDGARVRVELGERVVVQQLGDDPAGDEGIGYSVQAAEVLSSPIVPDEPVLAAALPHQVTVVLVAPAGQSPDAMTTATVRNSVEGGVSSFWSEQTGGAVSFDVVAERGWIATTSTCAAGAGLWNEVASTIGWQAGDGKHLLLYVSSTGGGSSCYAGLGTIGSSTASGGRAYVRSAGTSIIAHELGHNMSLGHSNGLLCPGATDGTFSGGWAGGCAAQGYRDYYDVMGISWSQLGTLSSVHATKLGAMTAQSRLDVTTPAQATLQPVSTLNGLRTLKLVDGATTYFVEYRPPSGRDAWLAQRPRGLLAGVLVRRSDPSDSRGSLVLDASPSSTVDTGDWEQPVVAGSTVSVAGGKFRVRVDSAAEGSAVVSVAVDGLWPAAGPPVQVSSPAAGARVGVGTVTVAGFGTAYEGTLLYEVTDPSGATVVTGFTGTGANGEMGPFSVGIPLVAGSYTVAVWAPDESDGESTLGPRPFEVRRSFTVG